MKNQVNEVTGNSEMQFISKLLSISEKVLVNVNGKNYKVATIEFVNADGELVRRSAFVYEGNYQNGMEIGTQYLTTAAKTIDANGEPSVIIHVSHLTGADRATLDDFQFEEQAEIKLTGATKVQPIANKANVIRK